MNNPILPAWFDQVVIIPNKEDIMIRVQQFQQLDVVRTGIFVLNVLVIENEIIVAFDFFRLKQIKLPMFSTFREAQQYMTNHMLFLLTMQDLFEFVNHTFRLLLQMKNHKILYKCYSFILSIQLRNLPLPEVIPSQQQQQQTLDLIEPPMKRIKQIQIDPPFAPTSPVYVDIMVPPEQQDCQIANELLIQAQLPCIHCHKLTNVYGLNPRRGCAKLACNRYVVTYHGQQYEASYCFKTHTHVIMLAYDSGVSDLTVCHVHPQGYIHVPVNECL